MLSDSSASSSSFVVVPSVVFPILCSHASRAAPLRRCCLPCGMAFPRRNNKKCPSPPFQETETLKLLPSDSCSPCAKHFLTATNLGLSSIFYRTAPEKSIFFCRTSQFFCRRLRQVSVRPAGLRSEARNIPFENKSAGRCGRRVRAQRPPVRKKERPPKGDSS